MAISNSLFILLLSSRNPAGRLQKKKWEEIAHFAQRNIHPIITCPGIRANVRPLQNAARSKALFPETQDAPKHSGAPGPADDKSSLEMLLHSSL